MLKEDNNTRISNLEIVVIVAVLNSREKWNSANFTNKINLVFPSPNITCIAVRRKAMHCICMVFSTFQFITLLLSIYLLCSITPQRVCLISTVHNFSKAECSRVVSKRLEPSPPAVTPRLSSALFPDLRTLYQLTQSAYYVRLLGTMAMIWRRHHPLAVCIMLKLYRVVQQVLKGNKEIICWCTGLPIPMYLLPMQP